MYTKGAVIGDKNCADFGAFMAGMGWPHKTELERTLVNGISMA
jgi:hypothetical protein